MQRTLWSLCVLGLWMAIFSTQEIETRLPFGRVAGVNVIVGRAGLETQLDFAALRAMGANWVSFVVQCEQRGTTLDCVNGPDAATIRHEMDAARAAGLRVMLKPHVETTEYAWRGEIPFHASWWNEYRAWVAGLAELQPDALAIGSELARMSGESNAWRGLARRAKKACGCLITYAANFDEAAKVVWWDAVDFIGVDAYFPLNAPERATIDEMLDAWNEHRAALKLLAQQTHKQIVFTEFGIQSRVGAHRSPNQCDPAVYDANEQAFYYASMFETFRAARWWAGALVWDWGADDWRLGFTPNDKPALGVLISEWRR